VTLADACKECVLGSLVGVGHFCTQAADFRALTAAQIDTEVALAKRALFDLRLKRATRQEYKSSDFKFNRKKVRTPVCVWMQSQGSSKIGS
jgi:ribosomal protein L29